MIVNFEGHWINVDSVSYHILLEKMNQEENEEMFKDWEIMK